MSAKQKIKTVKHPKLSSFDVDEVRGFLPPKDPLSRLPKTFDPWEELAGDLPKLLVSGKVKDRVNALKTISIRPLKSDSQIERAMMILSFIGHAYVWGEAIPAHRFPAALAVPWFELGTKLGRPPVLSYASYALHNWKRIDKKGPIALGNIALLQNFHGGVDEEWFILIHVDIEAKAANALKRLINLKAAVEGKQWKIVEQNLSAISSTLEEMYVSLARMPEFCDPYIYYHRVRPYIFGWKNQPTLPNGMYYDGVKAYSGRPQQFRGETGSQSSIIPALDAALGVTHRDDPLKAYLKEMRDYMPVTHNNFISYLEGGINVRETLIQHNDSAAIKQAFNSCVTGIEKFRSLHLQYAISYIQNQKQVSAANPNEIGTGGTPFVPYLRKHRDETGKHRI